MLVYNPLSYRMDAYLESHLLQKHLLNNNDFSVIVNKKRDTVT
jgi:hypothetical protein